MFFSYLRGSQSLYVLLQSRSFLPSIVGHEKRFIGGSKSVARRSSSEVWKRLTTVNSKAHQRINGRRNIDMSEAKHRIYGGELRD